MATTLVGARVNAARALAGALLRGLRERWQHTAGVAQRAEELSVTVDPAERELLVAVAWLHDIGYSPALHETGFHPLDAAAYLDRLGWPLRMCSLVAHHSGARFVAHARGLHAALARYPYEQSPVADALTYADQTVGPYGRRTSLDDRMTEMLARHGADSDQAKVHPRRAPFLRDVAERVELRLSGLDTVDGARR